MKEDISCTIDTSSSDMFSEDQAYLIKNTLHLTEKEFQLFSLLLQRKGQVVSHTDIISFVWPERSAAISKNNILQLIFRLRKKLTKKVNSALIRNISGQGYMLETPSKRNNDSPNTKREDILKKYKSCRLTPLIILLALLILGVFFMLFKS
ncbi:helix-turn-helix domain-containing protein [Cedecea neteri]|uniref:Helix-turn-helix domain-containing protein n=1 Tax=Cedecea neteri TaxID=158822 RepID=A0A291E5Y9_9ENTR|nr:helix-turn-helix domain-containing protein [Cedecea neteri]ATF95353.1 helix-turn-helix domain-containing protein [Cedecea neteri]